MNKKVNRRAFFVCLLVLLMHLTLLFKLPERLGFQRISKVEEGASRDMAILSTPAIYELKKGDEEIEPLFFISIPLVCSAIRQGIIEKDGLIPVARGGYNNNNPNWKSPLEILQDKDVAGLKVISKMIGRERLVNLLEQEGIAIKEGVSEEDIICGRGFLIGKKGLLSIYNNNVTGEYRGLFPYVVKDKMITKADNGFQFMDMKGGGYKAPLKAYLIEEREWLMPNLSNLPLKKAIERLCPYTSNMKIIGSGIVIDQSPKPFQRLKGEIECTIYGHVKKGVIEGVRPDRHGEGG